MQSEGYCSSRAFGATLRRWRLLHRVKQAHAAERLGVNQSTISRWETGQQAIEPAERRRLEDLLTARLSTSADAALAALVEGSPRAIHLVCDLSHCLLTLSAPRRLEFAACDGAFVGTSLRPFMTAELADVEDQLKATGWYDLPCPPALEIDTGANDSPLVPIRPSRCRWTRIILSDGTAARLVETIAPSLAPAACHA